MSYQDISRGGPRELIDVRHDNEDQAHRKLILDIFRLQTEVSSLVSEVGKLNGPYDTVALRQNIAGTLHRLQLSVRSLSTTVKRAHHADPSQQTSKIVSDFEGVLRSFQEAMKEAKRRETASLPTSHTQYPSRSAGTTPCESVGKDFEQQGEQDSSEKAKLLAMNLQVEYNETLIEEREEGIAEITQQIREVNEIFQDLAVLVNDQGLMLDDIEANIGSTAERTREGGRELLLADRHQRRSRNKMCFIVAAFAFVLAILVIVLSV
eukprot:jgi/Botrbrau1/10860/Bobra.0025s0038.1